MTFLQLAGAIVRGTCLCALTALVAPAAIAAPVATPAPLSTAAKAPIATPVPTPSPALNAYDFFAAAGNSLENGAIAASASPDLGTPISDRDAAMLKASANALDLLRKGFQYPFQKPANAPDDMGYVTKMRTLAFLLALDARAAQARGDWNAAARDSVQCIRFGIDLPHGGDITDLEIGTQCEALGRAGVAEALTRLAPLQAVALARQLSRLLARTVPYPDLLRAEQKEGLRLLLDIFKESDWQRTEKTTLSRDQLLSAYMRASELAIRNASLPYAAPKTGNRQPADPVLQMVLTPFANDGPPRLGNDNHRFLYEKNRALDSLLQAQAALLAYHTVQGYYPQTLRELVPLFFPAPPPDPFALGAALQYRQVDRSYLLYSLGPDGIDDGGRPIEDKAAKTDRDRFLVAAESLGDIVAGVNTR